MKDGLVYAERVREAFERLRAFSSPPTLEKPAEPLRQLAISVLGRIEGDQAGERALTHIFENILDWNELRVSTADEIAGLAGKALDKDPLGRCQALRKTLRGVFQRENGMNLEGLKTLKLREARHYLETLNGLDAYGVASVMLWSLGGHAIPVSEALLERLKREKCLDAHATQRQAQNFLERHIKASEAVEFCGLMNEYVHASWGNKNSVKTEDAPGDGATNSKAGKHKKQADSPAKKRASGENDESMNSS